ncbi:hypothetical protein PAGA_b0132 [Pseudoalteromonas agarivorans DSM 14585]|uniref:Uncharacterized protein n=1 Tax=Pseudoalteromonas agarivorans DSM 14585 TaxID=1312369 RepID=A0ACA8E1I8_9GAMM|nr:hypothetical protein PAGA_b0132 [Pseudoalteromonas agarivorans DSM 14585]
MSTANLTSTHHLDKTYSAMIHALQFTLCIQTAALCSCTQK